MDSAAAEQRGSPVRMPSPRMQRGSSPRMHQRGPASSSPSPSPCRSTDSLLSEDAPIEVPHWTLKVPVAVGAPLVSWSGYQKRLKELVCRLVFPNEVKVPGALALIGSQYDASPILVRLLRSIKQSRFKAAKMLFKSSSGCAVEDFLLAAEVDTHLKEDAETLSRSWYSSAWSNFEAEYLKTGEVIMLDNHEARRSLPVTSRQDQQRTKHTLQWIQAHLSQIHAHQNCGQFSRKFHSPRIGCASCSARLNAERERHATQEEQAKVAREERAAIEVKKLENKRAQLIAKEEAKAERKQEKEQKKQKKEEAAATAKEKAKAAKEKAKAEKLRRKEEAAAATKVANAIAAKERREARKAERLQRLGRCQSPEGRRQKRQILKRASEARSLAERQTPAASENGAHNDDDLDSLFARSEAQSEAGEEMVEEEEKEAEAENLTGNALKADYNESDFDFLCEEDGRDDAGGEEPVPSHKSQTNDGEDWDSDWSEAE